MTQQAVMDCDARCLTCGYLLRGLPEPVCPECGRRFDPCDPSTFDLHPAGWRRRLWVKRCIAVALVVGLISGLFPRGVLTGRMTFTCARCGESMQVSRFELKPPRWIPLRYPGWTWTTRVSEPIAGLASCKRHSYYVGVKFDMPNGGWASGQNTYRPGQFTVFNGLVATRSTAGKVLRVLMSPGKNGITVSYTRPPKPGP